jgi:hypothetical protein
MAPRTPYRLKDGTEVPSVTTLLGHLGWKSYGLMFWAHKLGKAGIDLKDERAKLADVGTMCHAFAQADITGKPRPQFLEADADQRQKAEDAFRGYLDWKASTRLDLIASEVALVSETHRFGGRLDAITAREGEAGLLDFKSSKDLYPDQIVQVAAYDALWTENRPDVPLTSWHILRWRPDGAFVHHTLSRTVLDRAWEAFRCCLQLNGIRKDLVA